jgi:hypothetical protein
MVTAISISILLIATVIVIIKIRKRKKEHGPQLGEMTSRDLPAEMKKPYVRRKKQHTCRKITSYGYPC